MGSTHVDIFLIYEQGFQGRVLIPGLSSKDLDTVMYQLLQSWQKIEDRISFTAGELQWNCTGLLRVEWNIVPMYLLWLW